MTDNNGLPFALTTLPLDNWLDLLSALPPSVAAHQLNQTLKQLREGHANHSVLLPLLIDITPFALRLSTNLIVSLLTGRLPASEINNGKISKSSIHLLKQLSLLFCRIAEGSELDDQQTQQAMYYAMQLIGFCLRGYCLFYEPPSETLWQKVASLYKIATTNYWLGIPQSSNLPEFKHQTNIIAVVKRNLLFTIMAPRLYTSPEINRIFLFSQLYFGLLDIYSHEDRPTQFDFYWSIDCHEPCQVRHFKGPIPIGYLALDAKRVGLELHKIATKTGLEPVTQAKLALQLSGYREIFNETNLTVPAFWQLAVGFKNIVEILTEQNKLNKISFLSVDDPKQSMALTGLSLIPIANNDAISENTLPTTPFTQPQLTSKVATFYNCPDNNYIVAEGKLFDCVNGEMAMIQKQQHPPMLAIVRYQQIHEPSGTTHILMEKVVGICSTYRFNNGHSHCQAIVVNKAKGPNEVFLTAGQYSLDSKIVLNTGKALHLIACIESTAFFARFRINADL